MTTDSLISARGLRKQYGARTAVEDVTFSVERGSVTALIGPNGAGKSTILGALVDLVTLDAGEIVIGGRPYAALSSPARTVGVMLDASALHPGRSVVETVVVVGMLVGVGRARCLECLDRVGLSSVRRNRVGSLSLGMRQRLGLAIALLGAPQILILDEPSNGLDPEGIHWLHDLLVDHARRGGAVLLSTHLLSDADRIADHVVALDRGRLVPSLTGVRRRRGDADTHPRSAYTEVSSSDDVTLADALSAAGMRIRSTEGSLVVDDTAESVGRVAHAAGLRLSRLIDVPLDLETEFLAATSGEFSAPATSSAARPMMGER